jgi:hypothetical protein
MHAKTLPVCGLDPRKTATMLMGVALALGATACGDSADDATQKAPRASTAQLERLLLRANEEPGFRPEGAVENDVGVATLAKKENVPPAEARRLRRDGFVSITVRRLSGGPEAAGVSNVQLFATSEGAQNTLTSQLRASTIRLQLPRVKIRRFTVPGIPGAAGWSASPNGMHPVGNVLWIQGRCLMVLGNQGPGPIAGSLSTGARAIYQRTKGQCP